ncbi:unnamed protein product [Callosobruchus maculatus]|uniref:Reverse transcriptase domain-containing protein n=1 Tax=Callosobruchus maculatus TaxID=64391 RepID=A0A653BFF7_CALMS|nr:unnamed protein product [Callosobruchus maculatus]
MRQVLDGCNGGITIGGSKISNLRFADDTTLIVSSQEELVALLNILEQHTAAYGLGIHYNKTKVMIVDREHDNHREISFVYLGSLIDKSGSCENEIRRRIQQSLVFSIFLYALETWTVKKADRSRIDAFEMWTWRRMLRVPYTAQRTNVSTLDELGNSKKLSSIVSTRMLTFFGHRYRSDNMEKPVVQAHAPSGRRRGRSLTRAVDTTKQLLDMSIKSATELTLPEITSNPIYSFADDSTLILCMEPGKPLSSQETVHRRQQHASLINVDIKTIVEWGLLNELQFNVQKTQATTLTMLFHVGLPTVEMEGHSIVESPSVKLLGININNNMSCMTTSKLYTPVQLLLIYKAQIRPSLEYCSHKRAIRLIDTPNLTKDLHSLEHRRRMAALSLFYRFCHGRCSSELSQIIAPKALRTRNS